MPLISGPLKSATTVAKPATAAIGDLYIVPTGGTGWPVGAGPGSMVKFTNTTTCSVVVPDTSQSFLAEDTQVLYTYLVVPAGFNTTPREIRSSYFVTLDDADAAAVAADRPLVIDNFIQLTSDVSLDAKLVCFEPNGLIDPNLKKLTVHGRISAPAGQRIFDCSRSKVAYPVVVSPGGGKRVKRHNRVFGRFGVSGRRPHYARASAHRVHRDAGGGGGDQGDVGQRDRGERLQHRHPWRLLGNSAE